MMDIPEYSRELKVRKATEAELPICGNIGTQAFRQPMHKDYQPETTLVGEVPGKGLVSCLCLRPAPGFWGEAQVPMSSIGSVATMPTEQKHGYAGALMTGAVHILREMGLAVCPLWPFSFAYYRKFGWELGALDIELTSTPSLLRSFSNRENVHPAEEMDRAGIQSVYETFARQHNGCTVRSENWWVQRFSEMGVQYLVHKGPDGKPDGYVRYRTQKRPDEDGLLVVGVELAGLNPRAEAELAAALADIPDVSQIRLLLPRNTSIPLLFPQRVSMKLAQRLQIRVLDVARAVSALVPSSKLEGTIRFEIWDWVLSPNTPVPAVVEIGDGHVESVRTTRKAPTFRTTIQVFSKIFTGLLSPREAVEWGLLEADPEILELVQALFHGRTPFRSDEEPG